MTTEKTNDNSTDQANLKSGIKESWLNERSASRIAWISFLGLILISIQFLFNFPFCNLNQTTLANYGQFVGGLIGALFSFAGVILIYVTFKEQKESNRTQDERLELQIKIYNQQQFETTFFNLLDSHVQLIQSFDGLTGSSIYSVQANWPNSGYAVLSRCADAFESSFRRAAEYQIGNPYCNYFTINYYPLNEASINEQIVLQAISHIEVISNYILNSKQIEESRKEEYAKILYASLNHSEVYFYVVRNYFQNGFIHFDFSDFNNFFSMQKEIQKCSFPLNQSLSFSYTNGNESQSSISTTHDRVKADLERIESLDNLLGLDLIKHNVQSKGCLIQHEKIQVLSPSRKELSIKFETSNYPDGVLFYLPVAQIVRNVFDYLFESSSERKSNPQEIHKISCCYSIDNYGLRCDIHYIINLQSNGLNKFTLTFE